MLKDTPSGNTISVIELHGVRLQSVTEEQCVQHIIDELDARRGGQVVPVNVEVVRRLVQDSSLRALWEDASIFTADGMPLVWASRVQGTPLPERVTGSSLISTLSAAAARRGRSIFLLGGESDTAEAAAAVLRQRSPGLRVAGTHYPEMGFEQDELAMAMLTDALISVKPDIIYVALGFPKQEKLIARLRGLLPQAWWISVGASFSFLCGRVRRAPPWMQRMGLEWLHRIGQQPRRIGKRVIRDLPFAGSLLAGAALRRVIGTRGQGTKREDTEFPGT